MLRTGSAFSEPCSQSIKHQGGRFAIELCLSLGRAASITIVFFGGVAAGSFQALGGIVGLPWLLPRGGGGDTEDTEIKAPSATNHEL